ncbi:hypothetical protein [Taibaiella soli]|uniref:Uncharacterized protein n=1 Tax=Taibaiella soli TaxID=1649169 RepID=A0A2W2AY52_9BACT|nr:hypothetical protein [Taibaiella soli]PZF72618.1 hypothetical protein DN068_12185 [Taibaiella soli]
MEQVNISREERYDLVWSESLTSLSKKYQVPYPEFKKICEKMNIPLASEASKNSKKRFLSSTDILKIPSEISHGTSTSQLNPLLRINFL